MKKKVTQLRSRLNRQPHLALNVESLRAAQLQAVLARGDRQLASCLPALAAGEPLSTALSNIGRSEEFFAQRTRSADEIFPWDVIDSGVDKAYLLAEYRRALAGELSVRCFSGCKRCGVCH